VAPSVCDALTAIAEFPHDGVAADAGAHVANVPTTNATDPSSAAIFEAISHLLARLASLVLRAFRAGRIHRWNALA